MRADANLDRVQSVELVAAVGKTMSVTLDLYDSARDPEDLSGQDPWGYIYDKNDALVLNLTPTSGDGTFIIKKLIASNIAPGWYQWAGGFYDSAGQDEKRFGGPVHLITY